MREAKDLSEIVAFGVLMQFSMGLIPKIRFKMHFLSIMFKAENVSKIQKHFFAIVQKQGTREQYVILQVILYPV